MEIVELPPEYLPADLHPFTRALCLCQALAPETLQQKRAEPFRLPPVSRTSPSFCNPGLQPQLLLPPEPLPTDIHVPLGFGQQLLVARPEEVLEAPLGL